MGWGHQQLGDLRGRRVIVTGGNSGIGFAAARRLAEHGAEVTLACRNRDLGRRAADRIDGAVSVADLDLAAMESVWTFASSWDGPLHILINNAGVMGPPKQRRTVDGYELQFGINHLGHFVLTGLLLSALLAAGGRVVTVSSVAHLGAAEDVLDANARGPYEPWRSYSNSKLANLLFATQLHRELTARRLPASSTAAHPGLSATGLVTSRQGIGARPAARLVGPVALAAAGARPDAAARSTLYAATEASPGSYTGPRLLRETRGPIGEARRSSLAQDERLARRLWQVSEELTGFRYDWRHAS